MSKRRVWTLVAAALLLAVPVQSQSALRVAPETLSRILDPHFTTSFTTRDLGYLIYDTLFAVDENFEPKPQMVESYTVSPDKLTYVFVLRSGLKWHDGQPVTAADCVASIRRWASRDSMGQTLTKFLASLDAPDAGTIKLRRRVPYHVAVEMLMTGRWMDAVEAKHWGLANHIVPKGQAIVKARDIARQLADGPPLLYPAIKQLLRHSEMLGEHEAFELHDSLHAVQKVVRSEDLREGARAFSAKRRPLWKGQ